MTRHTERPQRQALFLRDATRQATPRPVPCRSGDPAEEAARTPDQLQFENACFLAFHDRDPGVRAACRAMVSQRMGLRRPPTLDELRQADAALDALLGLEAKE